MNRTLQFEQIESLVHHARKVLVVSDYDGTLAPIAPTPAMAFLPERAYRALSRLVSVPQVTVAVISGRRLQDVRAKVGVNCIYGGNHGLEIHGGGIKFLHPGAVDFRRMLSAQCRHLERRVKRWPGAWVENKAFSATVHVREVAAENWPALFSDVLDEIERAAGAFRVRSGRAALEILPAIDWDKGSAVRYIRGRLGLEDALVLCLGDDATDETMFHCINDGINIHVGASEKTAAGFTLPDVPSVTDLLHRVATEIAQRSCTSAVWRAPRCASALAVERVKRI